MALRFILRIDLGVTVRCGWTRVTQYMADRREIDPGLEKRHCATVPHAVRMESFLFQCRRGFRGASKHRERMWRTPNLLIG